MRVLLITHYFPAHGGGVELSAYELARQLAGMGHQIVWLASNVDPAPDRVAGIECEPVPAWNFAERILQAPYPIWSPLHLGRLWRLIGDVDVVHAHEYVYVGSLAAVFMAKLRRKPVVLTQHTGAVAFPTFWLTRIYSAVNRSLGRRVLQYASEVVFVSDNVRRYFSGFCRFARPPRLIFNGLGPAWHPAESEDERQRLRQALDVGRDRDVLLFVGRFVVKKGLDVIESLVPQFRHVDWLVAGSGPVSPDDWGHANVKVLGRLEPQRLAQIYRAADLLILPSHTEGFPLVVQEALASGTAVLSTEEVATACPGVADLLYSAPVPTESADWDEWSRTLRRVLGDREFIQDRVARSQRARRLWSWQGCAEAYLQVYESVIGDP